MEQIDLTLRNICNKFFEYGQIRQNFDENLEYEINEDFEQRYLNEKFDDVGYLYQIELTIENDISEKIDTVVYKNFLYKSYGDVEFDKECLEKLIEFGKKFVKDNFEKYDTLIDEYILSGILTNVEEDFINDYDYFLELSKIIGVEISQLMITNCDKELKNFCNKYLN